MLAIKPPDLRCSLDLPVAYCMKRCCVLWKPASAAAWQVEADYWLKREEVEDSKLGVLGVGVLLWFLTLCFVGACYLVHIPL